MTFSVDKSVSALWAIAEPEMRARIESMAVAAARAALEDTVLEYCSYTRVSENGVTRPVGADLMGATFVHGTSRENDPQLHVHCALFQPRENPRGRQVAGAPPIPGLQLEEGGGRRVPRQSRLGPATASRRGAWSGTARTPSSRASPACRMTCWGTGRSRRKAIVARAGELGIPSLGNASRMAGVNKLTRAGKSHDNDPEVRHQRWGDEATSFVERKALIATVTGHEVDIPREAIPRAD